jgi:hypothetical protein
MSISEDGSIASHEKVLVVWWKVTMMRGVEARCSVGQSVRLTCG